VKFVHYYPRALVGNGGPTIAMWEWVKALKAAGQMVKIICDADLIDAQPLACSGVEIIPIRHRLKGRWRYPVDIGCHLDSNSIIIVHSAFVMGNLIAAMAAEKVGAKIVYVPHGAYDHAARQRNSILKRGWLLAEARLVDRGLAVHAFVDTEHPSIREVAANVSIITAPTPVSIPEEYAWRGGGGYIAWLGRYDIEHKGLDLFINAYGLVPQNLRVPVRLHGRDSTHTREDVSVLVKKAGLDDLISVGGSIEGHEKIEFLCNANFFIMPSRWESFSIALIETLALNVPCLISDSMPISRELSETGACIISSTQEQEFADVLSNILSKKIEISFLQPRKYVRSKLSHEVVGHAFVAQIEKAVARCRNG
jgi:glycosyltransferase involved in cell wall biosynthesis